MAHNSRGRMLLAFSEPTGIMESNEAGLLVIRRAIHLWSRYGNINLVIEGDSVNAIAWATGRKNASWRFVDIARDIRRMSRGRGVIFRHVSRSANNVTNFLVKIGVQK